MYCYCTLCNGAPFVSITRFLYYHSSAVTFGNVTKHNKWIIQRVFITQIKCETSACQKPLFTNGPLAMFKETSGAFSWRIIASIKTGIHANSQRTSTNKCSKCSRAVIRRPYCRSLSAISRVKCRYRAQHDTGCLQYIRSIPTLRVPHLLITASAAAPRPTCITLPALRSSIFFPISRSPPSPPSQSILPNQIDGCLLHASLWPEARVSEFAAPQGERKQYKITRQCSTPGPGSVTARLNLINTCLYWSRPHSPMFFLFFVFFSFALPASPLVYKRSHPLVTQLILMLWKEHWDKRSLFAFPCTCHDQSRGYGWSWVGVWSSVQSFYCDTRMS